MRAGVRTNTPIQFEEVSWARRAPVPARPAFGWIGGPVMLAVATAVLRMSDWPRH